MGKNERGNQVACLTERWKADWSLGLTNTIFYRLFLEPEAFIMERKMLLGIKVRVEQGNQAGTTSQLVMESKTSAAVTVSAAPQPQSTLSSPSSNESSTSGSST